ncbi:hypothetical protein [Croceivirga thetidis]|uniref:DUF2306 domain-containing protein n=1 Tax=Croceivirga thetidis TaxID=2721623 RepID=A0ABX1GQZ2_9FLAO|nr:hypothetical protein [Croceivirga thetidis]NKI32348.1 hypothetical protein [Croceivirga thetidis]
MKSIKNVFKTVRTKSPILYGIFLFHAVLALISLVGIFIDDRVLMGINVWIKSFKFSISGGIYILTVGYLTTLYPFSNRKRNIVNNIVSWTLAIEISIIVLQAARGVKSHYNQSNLVDGLLFAAMGILISIIVMTMVFFIVETIRLRMKTSRPVQWAILIGWIVVLLGSWVGGQMIGQMAHNVGVADGGEGLPILNWSTIAGDLRVAHFFGLHGIQIIPLFAWNLTKRWNTLERNRILLTVLFGLAYASWIAFTFYQAKQGMPLVRV